MDESWLGEIHPDKTERKLSGGFGFSFGVFFLCAFYFE